MSIWLQCLHGHNPRSYRLSMATVVQCLHSYSVSMVTVCVFVSLLRCGRVSDGAVAMWTSLCQHCRRRSLHVSPWLPGARGRHLVRRSVDNRTMKKPKSLFIQQVERAWKMCQSTSGVKQSYLAWSVVTRGTVRSGHERTVSESVSTSRLCWSNVHFEQCVYGHNQCEAVIWVPL